MALQVTNSNSSSNIVVKNQQSASTATKQKSPSAVQKNTDTYVRTVSNPQAKSTDPEWVTDKMPLNSLWDSRPDRTLRNIYKEVDDTLYAYYAGSTSKEAVINKVLETADKVFNYHVGLHRTTADDEANKAKVLHDVWDSFENSAVYTAVESGHVEGEKLAQELGNPNDRTWLYYNADYQYQSEDIKAVVLEKLQGVAEEKGYNINFDDSTPTYHKSYNQQWSHSAKTASKCGNMLDTSQTPPPGFKFFYKENMYSYSEQDAIKENLRQIYPDFDLKPYDYPFYDGFLQIEFGDYTAKGHVPHRYTPEGPHGFNMLTLAKSFGDFPVDSKMQDYLKNFDFFLKPSYGEYKRGQMNLNREIPRL